VAAAAQILLASQLAFLVFEIAALIHRINLLHQLEHGFSVSQAQGDAADSWVRASVGLLSVAFIATVVTWCIWQHGAQRAAGSLSSEPLKFTPGWAVGWWFIPFANLVQPFRTVNELWKASHGGVWRNLSTWFVIPLWWAFWIASFVHVWSGDGSASVGFGLGTFGQVPTTAAQLASRDSWEIVSVLFRIFAGVLAILIVRAVVVLQQSATQAWTPPVPLTGSDIPPPPPPAPMPPI
jgi:hypothetical protein